MCPDVAWCAVVMTGRGREPEGSNHTLRSQAWQHPARRELRCQDHGLRVVQGTVGNLRILLCVSLLDFLPSIASLSDLNFFLFFSPLSSLLGL